MAYYFPLLPEIFLVLASAALRMIDLFCLQSRRALNLHLNIAVLAVTLLLLWQQFGMQVQVFGGAFLVDEMSTLLKMAMVLTVGMVLFYSTEYLQERSMLKGEYYDLVTTGLLGMLIMASSGSTLVAYLGLEMLSLSLYTLVAFDRDNRRCTEAAIKYFVLGALSSGILLYGISMLYGVTGEIKFDAIASALNDDNRNNVALLLGLACIVVGLAFKLGAVPFHMWVPDVYTGAPLAVTLFISSAPKIAGFALTMRFLGDGLQALQGDWQDMLVILAVLSLAVGNIVAIAQDNIRRMLAYSTISHIGFLLLGILAGTQTGYAASMFYAITYAITSVAGFGMLVLLSSRGFEAENLSDLKGLFHHSPWLAFMLMLVLFSMAGVPPTVGFYAKLSVLNVVVDIGMVWLAVYAVIFSIIGAFYYLRAIRVIFFDDLEREMHTQSGSLFNVLLSLNSLSVLLLGIFPAGLMALCQSAFNVV